MAQKKPTIPPQAMQGIDDERREKYETKAHERGESKAKEASEHKLQMPRKKF